MNSPDPRLLDELRMTIRMAEANKKPEIEELCWQALYCALKMMTMTAPFDSSEGTTSKDMEEFSE